MPKLKKASRKSSAVVSSGAGGTYVYDNELGKVVKISDRIPGVSGRNRKSGLPSQAMGPCGRPCDQNRCG